MMKKLEFISLEPSKDPIPDKEKILVFMKQSPIIAVAPGIPKDHIATDWFTQYIYQKIYDVPKLYAELANTEGMVFHTEGTLGYEYPLKTRGLTEVIREELKIPDLLVVGDEVLTEDDDDAPEPFWYESTSLEEIMRMAEEGLETDHDRRVELLRALEYKYWDYYGAHGTEQDKEILNRMYTLMHKYVMSLEAERPVKQAKPSFAWDKFVE